MPHYLLILSIIAAIAGACVEGFKVIHNCADFDYEHLQL